MTKEQVKEAVKKGLLKLWEEMETDEDLKHDKAPFLEYSDSLQEAARAVMRVEFVEGDNDEENGEFKIVIYHRYDFAGTPADEWLGHVYSIFLPPYLKRNAVKYLLTEDEEFLNLLATDVYCYYFGDGDSEEFRKECYFSPYNVIHYLDEYAFNADEINTVSVEDWCQDIRSYEDFCKYCWDPNKTLAEAAEELEAQLEDNEDYVFIGNIELGLKSLARYWAEVEAEAKGYHKEAFVD